MGKIRGTNHHGRSKASKPSSPKHIDRNSLKEARHIDPARTPQNLYWTWRGEWQQPGDCEAAERAYYREAFQDGQEAQNERYRRKGNHGRVRTTDQVYDNSTTRPEGTLLYIGSIKDGLVDPADLWDCCQEYRAWEEAESEARGGFYKPLTMGLHLDEDGQYHVELHSVYQYRDADGNLRPGQNAALEAAGFDLPDPSQPRGRFNNRKMTWDAVRREKWLDVLEAHGYNVERTPDKNHGPHLGLPAWQAYQDTKAGLDTQQAALAAQAAQQQRIQAAQAQAVEQIKADRAAVQTDQAAVQANQASVQKWAGALEKWRGDEQRRLDGLAAQIAADVPTSDAAIIAQAKRRKLKDGRPLWDALAEDAAAAAKAAQAPAPDQAAQALIEAAQAEQKRLQEKWKEQQAGRQHQGPGFGG